MCEPANGFPLQTRQFGQDVVALCAWWEQGPSLVPRHEGIPGAGCQGIDVQATAAASRPHHNPPVPKEVLLGYNIRKSGCHCGPPPSQPTCAKGGAVGV